MAIIRPRLPDYHNIAITQEDADFGIPFLDEDIPFCLDPFLLFKSPSQQDNALHAGLINSFNYLGYLVNTGKEKIASEMLIRASECNEVGFGFSGTRQGLRIGPKTAANILSLFKVIPQIKQNGFVHLEEIQLYVDQIAKDRISDIVCTFLKSFLIDYTMDQCLKLGIPATDIDILNVYDLKANSFIDSEKVKLPTNPETQQPILLVPKRWLRRALWINCDDYVSGYYLKDVVKDETVAKNRIEILNFNRQNYDLVQVYVKEKEKIQADCKNDPLFQPIPILSAKRKFAAIKKLPTGKTDNADKIYEGLVCQLLASLLYPHLDFASEQVRTVSGVQIRDLIFYNSRSETFLEDIYKNYESLQLVFELKNVKNIERDHINQLNRYLANEFGKFGVLITRNDLPKAMFQNTIDLWSGHRRCIIALTDADLELMVNVYESKQRLPLEVVQK
ncbi:MAG: hypothetical protein FVQ85_19930 [Planctomycetes bacterium]|nr:hypothetical protein [Planctomycetota bacterium]